MAVTRARGKSPAIIDRSADLDEAAKKIAWGKAFNSGQICIAPDYLLVDESIRAPFVEKLRKALEAVGGNGSRGWLVNEHHAGRMKTLFDEAVKKLQARQQGGSSRNPFVMGTANVVRALTVMNECARATQVVWSA